MWHDKNTNIENTPYEPDGNGMKVCMPVQKYPQAKLTCACVPAGPEIPSRIKRYLPSECPVNCNDSAGYWIPVQSGRCIRSGSGVTVGSSGEVYCSRSECEQAGGNYWLQ